MDDLNERWEALGSPWRPGMRATIKPRWRSRVCADDEICDDYVEMDVANVPDGAVPDWTDHATLGALLGLVRERYGDPLAHLAPMGRGQVWLLWFECDFSLFFEGATEALEALDAGS